MAYDAFLKLTPATGVSPGIVGESTVTGHIGEVEPLSFSWPMTNPSGRGFTSTGQLGGAKFTFSEFVFTKNLDKASPGLFIACAQGTVFTEIQLSLRKAGTTSGVDYAKFRLQNAVITSIALDGAAGDEQPVESITVAFTMLLMEYSALNPNGTLAPPIKAGWSVLLNKPVTNF